MPKPTKIVFFGDTHADPTEGIWTKDRLTKRHKRQWWLNQQFDTAIAEIKALSQKHNVILCWGGDMVDRPGKDARDAIIERVLPLANKAAQMWGLLGTAYHVGAGGVEDRQVYQELGVKSERIAHGHRLIEGKRRIWWSHHGAALGIDPYLGLANTAKKVATICQRRGWELPNWLVFHHTHEYAQSEYRLQVAGEWQIVRAVVCPCWQLPNDYSAKRLMWRAPDIGYLVYDVETDTMTPRTFPIPEGLLYG